MEKYRFHRLDLAREEDLDRVRRGLAGLELGRRRGLVEGGTNKYIWEKVQKNERWAWLQRKRVLIEPSRRIFQTKVQR